MTCKFPINSRRILALCFLFVIACQQNEQTKNNQLNEFLKDSLVLISIERLVPDFISPWQAGNAKSSQVLAVAVDKEHLLTTADAVHFAHSVRMQKIGENKTTDLEIAFVDSEINLALLKPLGQKNHGLNALHVGKDAKYGEELTLVQQRDKQEFIFSNAKLENLKTQNLNSWYPGTFYKLTENNFSASPSSPLLSGHQVRGILSETFKSGAWYIPASQIQSFLSDYKLNKKNYKGFAVLGIAYKEIESETLMEYLKLNASQDGVMITEVLEQSPFKNLFMPGDVLTKVGHHSLSKNGEYKHELWGNLSLAHLMSSYRAGDTLTLEVIRQGQVKNLTATLTKFDSNHFRINETLGQKEPAHLIIGGLVFQELTVPYFNNHFGKDWKTEAPLRLLNLFYNDRYPSKLTREKHVVLQKVLNHRYLTGYEGISHQVLSAINGKSVTSITQLREKYLETKNSKEQYAIFEFEPLDTKIIIDIKKVSEYNKETLKLYTIENSNQFID
ncbi:MAG: PDZ domain-containing protein [Oligoflexales bacterium]|nr:PDZ domain-containing protein [Oligoflexales bacterium]